MASGPGTEPDELTRARMEISALKILNQVMLLYIASAIDKDDTSRVLRAISHTANNQLKNTEFLDDSTADLWRAEMAKTIDWVFEPFVKKHG